MGLKRYFAKDYSKSQQLRLIVQLFFLAVTLFTGWRFVQFVHFLQQGGREMPRPAGVEAFLPISSLMSLKYWILTGDFNPIHPAGLVLFIAILLMALLVKKSFCSWMCPIGFLSEYLWKLGRKLFGKNLILPYWLDWPLRSLKYLILIFFAWGIFVDMNAEALRAFIYGDYNRVADIKMLLFFVHISTFSLTVIIVLALLSIVIRNFWCRYLCPYGALLGFTGLFSPLRITRNPETCVDCRECTAACPSNIQVHKKIQVLSDECTSCLACTAACKEPNTLTFNVVKKKKTVSAGWVAAAVLLIFLLLTGIARMTGHWQNNISNDEYKSRIEHLDDPVYNHTAE
jgi:polyferredoxin